MHGHRDDVPFVEYLANGALLDLKGRGDSTPVGRPTILAAHLDGPVGRGIVAVGLGAGLDARSLLSLVATESTLLAVRLLPSIVVVAGNEEADIGHDHQRAVLLQRLLHPLVADVRSAVEGLLSEVLVLDVARNRVVVRRAAESADEVEMVAGLEVLLLVLLKPVQLGDEESQLLGILRIDSDRCPTAGPVRWRKTERLPFL